MRHPIDFDGIKAAALRSAHQLLQELLPGGKFQGDEYVVRNPLRNDQHPGSFKINWKTGEWSDFAIGESGGDLTSLVAYLRGISQVDAVRELAAKIGIPVPKLYAAPVSANAKKRDASLVMPAPADAPAPPTTHPALGRPIQSWPYKDATGGVIGYVLRFDGADGKEFRPLTLWRDSAGRLQWRWQSWPVKRPLYGLQELAERPSADVVACEGEKATDAARRLLPDFVVITSPNGSKSADKADWSPLRGRNVVIWPDADLPGDEYAEAVAKCATNAGAKSIAIASPPSGVDEGWDAADALEEGWTSADAAEFIADAVSWEPKTATDPLDGLIEKTATDPGAAFRPAVLERLVALKKDDRAAFEALRAELKSAGCRMKALDEAIEEENEDTGGGRRPSQADVLIALAQSAELFHAPDGTGFADIDINGHRETWPIRSKGFRRWLSRCFYEATGGAPSSEALQSALNVIEARAHFDAPELAVHIRVGGLNDRLYLDLGDQSWRAVEIDATGWRIIDSPPVRFRRAAGMQPLPMPMSGGSVEKLRSFLNVKTDADFVLAVSSLLAAFRDCGPYPVLVLSGEQGSAKSTFSALLRALLDPNTAPLRALPREDRDLFIAANNGHVLAFDNVSGLRDWISDTLCRLATGGGFAVRQLYTDDDEVLFDAMRPVILNGIEDIVSKPDLADRTIFLTLAAIPEEGRRSEKEIWSALKRERPAILGALFDAVSTGLRRLPETRLEELPRMADFALWRRPARLR